ncbi:kinesin light chain [Fusarium sp. NRRL 25303]|nr:kinesin light chain [Fusarium sp. NRRL 25303]
MRRLELRALKWPFDSKDVSGIVANLERYKQTIMLCLQVDQTTILLDIQQKFDSVSLQPCGDRPIARIPCFNVPFERDPDFVDRPDITTWLQSQNTGSISRMALVGMGGFGKSQVTIQFAHHIHSESPQTSVYWTEEAGSWLMILDNADDANLFYPIHTSGAKAVTGSANENTISRTDQQPLAVYLPKRRNGTILATSRSMDAAEKLTGSHKAIYRVSTMDGAQGLQLFRNKLDGDFDKHAAADLLRVLDYIPLAITQAAAYINRRAPRISIKSYLDTFRESDKKKGSLLNRDAGDLRRYETVSNSVVTTWQVTFEQIRHERPSAAKLLSFMSFFNPQGIPEFVLYDYNADPTDEADRDVVRDSFEDDLDVLRGYSLVSVTETGGVYGTFETWPICQMLLPHVEPVFEKEPLLEGLLDWAYLLTNCARYMLTIGKYGVAENLSKMAVSTRSKVLGEEHPDTLTSMANLASTYWNQGRWKEAEELDMAFQQTMLYYTESMLSIKSKGILDDWLADIKFETDTT